MFYKAIDYLIALLFLSFIHDPLQAMERPAKRIKLTEQKNRDLMFSARSIDEIKSLISHGYSIHATDGYGKTPLHAAIFDRNFLSAQNLIECGADIEAKTYLGETPLLLACKIGNWSLIELLLSKKANIYAKDKFSNSVLHTVAIGRLSKHKYFNDDYNKTETDHHHGTCMIQLLKRLKSDVILEKNNRERDVFFIWAYQGHSCNKSDTTECEYLNALFILFNKLPNNYKFI